jgi:hypothetical protein
MPTRTLNLLPISVLLVCGASCQRGSVAPNGFMVDLATSGESCGDGSLIVAAAIGGHRAKLNAEPDRTFSETVQPSGDTSKPASRGHLKTGQLKASRTVIVLPHRWHFRQEFFKLNLPSAPNSVYTDLIWAEDRATQGCDPSADPAAGMAGRRQPPQKRTAILAENAVNPRGLGTASPTEESLLPIWFCSREIEWSHIHCGAPAAAVAVFVRQLRGPHLSTCP